MLWLSLSMLACAPGGEAVPVPRLEVPARVELGGLAVGQRSQHQVEVRNLGLGAANLRATVGPSLSLSRERYEIPGGGSLEISLIVQPESYRTIDSWLRLEDAGPTVESAVLGEVEADADGDGFDTEAAGGTDCDDSDPSVHPGALEQCSGTDSDCNGSIDDVEDPPRWYRDADGDGYGVESDVLTGCEPSPGYIGQAGDCDDSSASIHPGASENWYDGVDQDCSGGSDFDQDGDGFDNAGTEGSDCVDSDPAIHPEAEEIWYDGVDQDCSGGSDFDQDGDGDELPPRGSDCDDEDAERSSLAAETPDGRDEDCDGLVDEDFVQRGDLLFTEVMRQPESVGAAGQYLELANRSANPVELGGYELEVDGAVLELGPASLTPNEVLLFCAELDAALNGGVEGCVELLPAELTEISWVELYAESRLDELDLAVVPSTTGRAAEVRAEAQDPDANDSAAAWCAATSSYGSGGAGSPGAIEPSCP